MYKVILGVMLATAIFSLMPAHTKVLTVNGKDGSMVTSTSVPTDSQQF